MKLTAHVPAELAALLAADGRLDATTTSGKLRQVLEDRYQPPGALLSRQEAARRLGVAGDTVRTWHREGKIEAVRLPSGKLRYRAADVERILNAPQA